MDGTSAYYSDPFAAGAIKRVPKAGGATTDVGVTGGWLAVDATHCYWVETLTGMQGRVMRAVIGGGAPETLAVTGGENISWLTLDATTLFWTSITVPRVNRRMPLAGGTITVIEANADSNVAFDAAFLYFSQIDATFGTRIIKRPRAGGADETIGLGGSLGGIAQVGVTANGVFLLDIGSAGAAGTGRILKL